MKFISTRGQAPDLSFTDTMLTGLAADGGLYVPQHWPQIDPNSIKEASYPELATKLLSAFATDLNDLDRFCSKAYNTSQPDCRFRDTKGSIAPLAQITDQISIMELFQGPTLSFKDYALQLLGHLFEHVLEARNETLTILTATSGDTGSAAIEACRGHDRIRLFVLHPYERVSDVQRRQMTTVQADNIHNIAIKGSFDDCQNMVKTLFADKEFKAKHRLSAMNSINWGRINAQMVYYAHALQSYNEPVSFVVPSGNFGNIFAGYALKSMGFPIKKLVIATNKNDILTRFFESGEMKMHGVHPSLSPSMDIQISSNFERYLFDLFERDSKRLEQTMQSFKQNKSLKLESDLMDKARETFSAGRCDDEQTLNTIKLIHDQTNGMIIDPHTATGVHVANQHIRDGKLDGPVIVLGTAHPAKFPDAVKKAIDIEPPLPKDLADLYQRDEYYTVVENDESALRQAIER